jgi:hypothetical protein
MPMRPIPRVARPRRDYNGIGPRPKIRAVTVARCVIPHRTEAADAQRSPSKGAKARGRVAKGHVARTAKVPINC